MAVTAALRPTVDLRSITDDVFRRLESAGLALRPKEVRADLFHDVLDDEAWKLVLVLPKPTGDTWDTGQAYELKLAAIKAFDSDVAGTDLEKPGTTIAMVTTDEAVPEDIAPDEPDEDDAILGGAAW